MYARTSWLGLVFLLSTLLIPTTAFAQGSIGGVVKDSTGAVLPGVTVEAASPVLIEKVRTAVSDGSGRYQIVDLRPGTYTVTFTLAGFNTVKRDGVTLAGSGNVAVDADLRVGALEETITVTGEAPVVDAQTLDAAARAQLRDRGRAAERAQLLRPRAHDSRHASAAATTSAASLIQDVGQSVTVHGSRNVDQRVTVNGVNTMTLQAGGNIGGQTPDVGSAAEVTVDTNSLSADLPTGGVRINFVPKDGGNTLLELDVPHLREREPAGRQLLRRAARRRPGHAEQDRQRLRHQRVARRPVQAGQGVVLVLDALQHGRERGRRSSRTRTPTTRTSGSTSPTRRKPGVNKGTQFNSSLRVTWQATPRNKIAGTYKADKWCNCPNNISATRVARGRPRPPLPASAPGARASGRRRSPTSCSSKPSACTSTSAGATCTCRVNDGSLDDPAQRSDAAADDLASSSRANNLTYRVADELQQHARCRAATYRAAMSYVTGIARVQVRLQPHARLSRRVPVHAEPGELPLQQRRAEPDHPARRPVPRRRPTSTTTSASTRRTAGRSTAGRCSGALRFDYFATSFPEQHARAGAAHAEPQHHLPGAGQHLVEGPHLPQRPRLRPVRQRQDGAEGRRSTSTCSARR